MKKILIIILILSLLFSCSKENSNPTASTSKPADNEKYIKITSPVSGEAFQKGKILYIRTESRGVDAVTIYLLHNHNNILTIENNYVSPTSMSWTVDNSLPADSCYSIKVEDRNQKNIFDESESFFGIVEPVSIKFVWSFYPLPPSNSFTAVFNINKVNYSKFTGDGFLYLSDGTLRLIKIDGSFNYPSEFNLNLRFSISNSIFITFKGKFSSTNEIDGSFDGKIEQNQFYSAIATIMHE